MRLRLLFLYYRLHSIITTMHTLPSVKRRKLATSEEKFPEHLRKLNQEEDGGKAEQVKYITRKGSHATDGVSTNSRSPAARVTVNWSEHLASLTKEVSPPPLQRLTSNLSATPSHPCKLIENCFVFRLLQAPPR